MTTNGHPRRTLLRHPLAALGGALVLAGGALFIILVLIDLSAAHENMYRSLVTFILAPAVILLGVLLFLISVRLQIGRARRAGEDVRFTLSIDPADPKYIRNLWLFLAFTAVLVLVVVYAGTEAYDATESVVFCGETCHRVMEPQYVTYHNSPHARVACAECHIGPGASFWVKSKVDGLRQVWATALNTYPEPIPTPIVNLRPARETCEQCHWPEQFYGDKLLVRTYYRTDEQNSPWTVALRVKIGGGTPRATGQAGGIHYHMLTERRLEYIPADEKRSVIAWVRSIGPEGDTTVWVNADAEQPAVADSADAIRAFDCMDCHNRPSHRFNPPATAVNRALNRHELSAELPSIRKLAVDLLNAEYKTKPQALEAIAQGLREYYRTNYPDRVEAQKDDIERAAAVLQEIYTLNFFPEMKTDYRVRENHLSHFVSDGCFRCHTPSMTNAAGEPMKNDCRTCHLIVAQGPSTAIDSLEMNLAGLEFRHPEDIDEAWREVNCTACHTADQGY
ncbi:MAG TPA: NapC/NirT family cytochrome c [candidate division Zixibacteria bacterium]|nr:NapC/NirT family cytochrome c [candidate division Zixibacteria bacterium]HPM36506.1 NapC/NirT family cytochrome c [candidate division Zixibacteria bacterium]